MPPKKNKKSEQPKGNVVCQTQDKVQQQNNPMKTKFISLCVKKMSESLPKQTFCNSSSVYYRSNNDEKNNKDNEKTPKTSKKSRPSKKKSDPDQRVRISEPFSLGRERLREESGWNPLSNPVLDSENHTHTENNNNNNHKTEESVSNNCELCSNEQIKLESHFYEYLPVHPNISVKCGYCSVFIPSNNLIYYIEQPQARKRYSPICLDCYNK